MIFFYKQKTAYEMRISDWSSDVCSSDLFTNYEIGSWVSLFKNKLDLDITFYELLGTNELLNIRQPDGSTDYQSAGKTIHKGVEYGATYRPTSEIGRESCRERVCQ